MSKQSEEAKWRERVVALLVDIRDRLTPPAQAPAQAVVEAEVAGLMAACKGKLYTEEELDELVPLVGRNNPRLLTLLRDMAAGPRMTDRYRSANPPDMFEIARP